MEENVRKAKRRLVVFLVVCLSIAFSSFGFVFFMWFSHDLNKGEDVGNVSKEVLSSEENKGKYVTLQIDLIPVLMMPTLTEREQFYFVTDVNDQTYIMKLSDETFVSITDEIDPGTEKLTSPYRLTGILEYINGEVQKLALSNSHFVSKDQEINAGNFSEYFGALYVKENEVSQRLVTVYTIIALFGVFLLVLAFGYLVPALFKIRKGNFGILDEKNMVRALEKYVPDGETMIAGVHAVGLETEVKQIFGGCVKDGDKLVPDETGTAIEVTKSKCSKYDVYICITQRYLILSECGKYKHYYELNDKPDMEGADVERIKTCIPIEEIGTCFPLVEIQVCKIKNIWMGAVQCTITMKNGTLLKFMLPKSGGPGMPRHEQYREAILNRLRLIREDGCE